MKWIIAFLLLLCLLPLASCQSMKNVIPSEMNPDDLPDERALQDEFTREFLQSVEETRPGYYPFLSKTGKYKMDFPAGGIIYNSFYSLKKSNFESFLSEVKDATNADFTLFFYGGSKHNSIESNLEWFQGRIGESIDFSTIEGNETNIYYNSLIDNNLYQNVAYIQNMQDKGGIEIIFTIDCEMSNSECENTDSIQKEFLNWVRTIKFINN